MGPGTQHTEAASAEGSRERHPGFSEAPLSPEGLTCPFLWSSGVPWHDCSLPAVTGDCCVPMTKTSVRASQGIPSHSLAEQGVKGASWNPLLPVAPGKNSDPGTVLALEEIWEKQPIPGVPLPLGSLFPHLSSSFLQSGPSTCPSLFLLLPRLLPKQRMGGAPREEREFIQTGGMTGTSDWLVRAILFPGCHSSHFLGLSVMKLITLFSNNPCN